MDAKQTAALRAEIESTKSIAANWEIFEKQTLHAVTSEAQRNDMRMAFYAGCAVIYEMLMRTANSDGEESGLQLIATIDYELREEAAQRVAQAFGMALTQPVAH